MADGCHSLSVEFFVAVVVVVVCVCVLHNGNERKQMQESVFFGVVNNVTGSRLCKKL